LDHGHGSWLNTNVETISRFKAKCLSVLRRVRRAEPALVTRFGKLIAGIEPPWSRAKAATWIGSFQSRGRLVDDIVSPASVERDWEALRHCARFRAIAPRVYPRGVFKFRSIEEAQAARQRVADEGALAG
jgi:antitoxin (DNA-binding transcriptional repressor) of toxin-antitoxin stability system